MSSQVSTECGGGGPSVEERVKALHDHSYLFGKIAEFPQAGIYETFPEGFAIARAYTESEVHRRQRAVKRYLQRSVRPEEPSPNEVDHRETMMDFVDALLLHGRVAKTSEEMGSSPPPSMKSMDFYRACSRVKESGMRAANGEIASMYRQRGEPIPSNLATVDGESLSPMAQFICDWILNPLVGYIAGRPKDILVGLPMYERRLPDEGESRRRRTLNTNTVEAVAKASVYVLAILILIAPIATFTVVGEQSQRVVIMPLFCLILGASAQLMGTSAMPSFMMVIAYFQAMVFYVGN